MAKIPTKKLLRLPKRSKIGVNDNTYIVTRVSHYKTVDECDDNQDYGGGVKIQLGPEYYLIYERRYNQWRFIRVTKKRGLIFSSETHLPITIKEIKILSKKQTEKLKSSNKSS